MRIVIGTEAYICGGTCCRADYCGGINPRLGNIRGNCADIHQPCPCNDIRQINGQAFFDPFPSHMR
ncbi:MAG: hypothetical protein ACP5E4_02245 [Candidatus Aenigmatarchaeota archaeon]